MSAILHILSESFRAATGLGVLALLAGLPHAERLDGWLPPLVGLAALAGATAGAVLALRAVRPS